MIHSFSWMEASQIWLHPVVAELPPLCLTKRSITSPVPWTQPPLPGWGCSIPFCPCEWPLCTLGAHLWGALACNWTLDVEIFGAAGPPHPGNQALLSPCPSLFAQQLFPPPPTLLLFLSAVGLQESLRDGLLFCARCLVVLLVASFLWCTKALPYSLFLPFFSLTSPAAKEPLFDHIRRERERSVVLLTLPLAFDSLCAADRFAWYQPAAAAEFPLLHCVQPIFLSQIP